MERSAPWGLRLLLRSPGARCLLFLPLARQVRDDSDHALEQHQLAAMMHFVLFRGQQHVEASSRCWSAAGRHGQNLVKE